MLDIARAFLHEAPGVDVDDELVLGFVERFIDQWNTSTRSIDGVDALLSGISQRYRLSIISNTFYPPLVVGNLERMGLRGYFADVVMSAEHGSRKPDPSIFRDTLARLGSSAADAVYVGDSYEADYEGGLAAGLRAILVDPERRRPELGPNRVGHILELADLLSDRH
jgi:putative hydrolase of the HAD superfamily